MVGRGSSLFGLGCIHCCARVGSRDRGEGVVEVGVWGGCLRLLVHST